MKNEIEIFSKEYEDNPYLFYEKMRNDLPLFFHEASQSYVISRWDDVGKALKDSSAFSNASYQWQLGPIHGKTIAEMDGKEHSAHRNTIIPFFRNKELMDNFYQEIQKCADKLYGKMKGKALIDYRNDFSKVFPISVISLLLDLPENDLPLFSEWYMQFSAYFQNIKNEEEVKQQGFIARDEFGEYIRSHILQRQKNPKNDLLSTLCSADIDGELLPYDFIKGFCSLLLLAGGETTDKALANMVRNLVMHPEQMESIRKDRSLVDLAICESLRFSPPIHMVIRITTEEVILSGGRIPANANVLCMLGAANRDSSQFQDPDIFNIFRSNLDVKTTFTGASNLRTFGLGRHFCLGSQLSKLEMNIAINGLLDYADIIEFAEGKLPSEVGIFSRYPKTLPLSIK